MSDKPNSRLSINPSTQLPNVQNFGELNHFLHAATASNESLLLADGMRSMANSIEAVLAITNREADPAALAPTLIDLMTVLREHRSLVIALSPAWRGLYEYASYLAALNNFRVLIGQWLLPAQPQGAADSAAERPVGLEDFELIAWRMLGEGMLLIDMYEQLCRREASDSSVAALDQALVQKARHWWERLRR